MKTAFIAILLLCLLPFLTYAQDAAAIIKKVTDKLNSVKDYQAEGILKTDVSFMKIPESKVTVYFKNPDKFKIKKDQGISVVPKGGVSINLNALFAGNNYTVVSAGSSRINGIDLTIIKLLPLAENSEVMISTLYIDEKESLIRKASTTTKDNGTYEMELSYKSYAKWGLPDKVVFVFNTVDYKLPKGVTFEYETGEKPSKEKSIKNQKGKVEITYSKYDINKGIPDNVFK